MKDGACSREDHLFIQGLLALIAVSFMMTQTNTTTVRYLLRLKGIGHCDSGGSLSRFESWLVLKENQGFLRHRLNVIFRLKIVRVAKVLLFLDLVDRCLPSLIMIFRTLTMSI